MLYLPITDSWILSPLARRVYCACAIASLMFFVSSVGLRVEVDINGPQWLTRSPLALVVGGLLWGGILGSALLWVALWYFWFSFDP